MNYRVVSFCFSRPHHLKAKVTGTPIAREEWPDSELIHCQRNFNSHHCRIWKSVCQKF
jgi:hypothetical protein